MRRDRHTSHKDVGEQPTIVLVTWFALLILGGVAVVLWGRQREVRRLKQAVLLAGENPGRIAPVAHLIAVLGPEGAHSFMARVAAEYAVFAYDGESRFCEIHRRGHKFTPESLSPDKLLLSYVGDDAQPEREPTAMWRPTLPIKVEIRSIKFSPDGIQVAVRWPGSSKEGEAGFRQGQCFIPWLPGERPEPGRFEPEGGWR